MNIVFIGPVFYGYNEEILSLLKTKYKKVFFFNEYPFSNQTRYKYVVKLFPFMKNNIWRIYTNRIMSVIKCYEIDKIFIIRGEELPEYFLKQLHLIKPAIEIINYQWDSLRNNPNGQIISNYACCNYTFDRYDAENNETFEYLPLFYTWKQNINYNRELKYDVLFFGSYTKERFSIVNELVSKLESENLSYKIFLYIPFLSFVSKFISGYKIPYKFISFYSTGRREYQELVESSRCLFDLPTKGQTGATMRTIETFSMRKKLITSNRSLEKDSFFSHQNIMYWPISDNKSIRKFIFSEYDMAVQDKVLSLEKWLKSMNLI